MGFEYIVDIVLICLHRMVVIFPVVFYSKWYVKPFGKQSEQMSHIISVHAGKVQYDSKASLYHLKYWHCRLRIFFEFGD